VPVLSRLAVAAPVVVGVAVVRVIVARRTDSEGGRAGPDLLRRDQFRCGEDLLQGLQPAPVVVERLPHRRASSRLPIP
jgi:hypothetical protein